MELAFNSSRLLVVLGGLSRAQQLAFGASCCERILPNYLAFQSDTGWGDFQPVRKALDVVWTSLEHEAIPSNIDNLTLECERAAPDSEDFTSLYVSFAQDACFAVCGLLDFLLLPESNKIVLAGEYATNSVDLFVQEIEGMAPDDPDLEAKILAHPLMQRELENQRADIEKISSASVLDSGFLKSLRNASWNGGKSNLDLP